MTIYADAYDKSYIAEAIEQLEREKNKNTTTIIDAEFIDIKQIECKHGQDLDT